MGNRLLAALFMLIWLFILSGCGMKWSPRWQDAAVDQPTEQSEALVQKAQLLFDQAKDRASLLVSIAAHEKALTLNPGDYATLAALSTQYVLLGAAYTEDRAEKSKHFLQAMAYAELGMYTNADFKEKVAGGSAFWDAADVLEKEQIEAMFFWVTALQYEFKEGMTLPGKIVNVNWMQRGLIFLDRVEQVDPDLGGGSVEFAKGICYYVLPGWKGGSEEKGDEAMARSIARSDGWLLPRWARGKYYYPMKGEDDKSREDLEWVASRNLAEFKDPLPWKVHFQDDARARLSRL